MTQLHIAKRPCATCPYAKSTPPGIWHADEYRKLAKYDHDPCADNLATFLCHQSNATGVKTACRGWLLVHPDSVAVRIGIALGKLDAEKVYAPSSVACYSTGAEACAAGLRGIKRPPRAARIATAKLIRRGAGQ